MKSYHMSLNSGKNAPKKRFRGAKGKVAIEEFQSRLRLRWTHQRKRYVLSLYANTPANMKSALRVAREIEHDISRDVFDDTLVKYGKTPPKPSPILSMTLIESFEYWTREYRHKNCNENVHYWHMRNILKRWGGGVNEKNILKKLNGEKFCGQTYNERLSMLTKFSLWLVKQGIWSTNPFDDVSRKKKNKSARPERKPFSMEELFSILDAVKTDRFCPSSSRYTHSHYYPFLYFIFKTGVRNAEAVGLRVKHVDLMKHLIHIQETMARTVKGSNAAARVRKQTKNGKVRYLPLTDDLEDLLTPLVKDKPAEDFVFQSYSKGPIDDRNFQRRVFSVVLKGLDIPHRALYAARHTFGSRCINEGMSPVMTAFLMGNNPETALRNYTHQISLPTILPLIKNNLEPDGKS